MLHLINTLFIFSLREECLCPYSQKCRVKILNKIPFANKTMERKKNATTKHVGNSLMLVLIYIFEFCFFFSLLCLNTVKFAFSRVNSFQKFHNNILLNKKKRNGKSRINDGKALFHCFSGYAVFFHSLCLSKK